MNLKLIFTLLKSQKNFRFPKKSDVLLYDDHGIDLMKILFSNNNFSILNTRKEIINLPILIICLLNFKFKLDDYFFYYIKYVDPKIIVTHNDNYISFYNVAQRFKNKKFIIIQRSVRSYHSDIYPLLKKKIEINGSPKFSIDKFFVYNKQTQKEFSKYVDADFEVIGSAIANDHKQKNKTDEVISYVSNYAKSADDKSIYYTGTDDILKKDIRNSCIKDIRLIYNFCRSKKFKLNILAKMNILIVGPELVALEKKFYEEALPNRQFDLIECKNRDNFKELDRSALVIGEVSNLLYESIFRGNKTFFLNSYPDHKILNTKRFGYLSGYPSAGPFWANSTCTNIEESLNKVLKMTSYQWKETTNIYNPELIYLDENNSKLKNYFKLQGF